MRHRKTLWVPLAISAAILSGAAPDDEDALGGTATEAKAKAEEIVKQHTVLQTLVVQAREAAAGGKNVSEAVADLEKKYAEQAARTQDPAARQELSYALSLMHQEGMRKRLEQQAAINPKIPQWALNLAAQASSGGADEAGVAARSGAWDRAGKAGAFVDRGTGTPFFSGTLTSGRSKWRVPEEIERQLDQWKPHVERSQGALGQIEEIRSAAARNRDAKKKLEAEIAQIKQNRATAAQNLAAIEGKVGALPASSAAVDQEMATIKQANDKCAADKNQLNAQRERINEAIRNRNAQIERNNQQMNADPTAFYNSHKADCVVTGTSQQGNQTITHYYYRPTQQLVDQNTSDVAGRDRIIAQMNSIGKEMDNQVERWTRLKDVKDGVWYKNRVAELDRLEKGKIDRIEQLQQEHTESRQKIAQILEQLRGIARNLRERVRQAEEAIQSIRANH